MQQASYDLYIGRGRDPETGEPGEWGNPFSHRPSRVPGVIVVSSVEEAIVRHKRWIYDQPRRGCRAGDGAAARIASLEPPDRAP